MVFFPWEGLQMGRSEFFKWWRKKNHNEIILALNLIVLKFNGIVNVEVFEIQLNGE